MALTVDLRPKGYFIQSTAFPSIVSCIDNGSGIAQIETNSAHSLITGEIVYIKSNVNNYNGFKQVFVGNTVQFLLRELDGINFVMFVKSFDVDNADIKYTFSPTKSHNWNCVHLPIVYKISNTFWPTNSADTVRTISSVTDSNGYCNITASGDIKATGSAAALEFVNITNATDDNLNGVWQIITYSSDTSFILNIPYSAANDTALTGASIQYYYNNYVTKVQVWGGLNNGHAYYGQKPFELLATLDLIPDENNICMFSISEILKKQIEIENNLLLGTLPNNLDAWTGFFIKYGEEYDDSDGTTLSRSTVSYTSDLASFEGYAVNSILAFKNVYSGSMSEYVAGNSTQKFLTNWERPTIFSDKYFDLGFILGASVSTIALKEIPYSVNGSPGATEITSVENSDEGIYRVALSDPDCDYAYIEASILSDIYSGNAEGLLLPSAWTDLAILGNVAFDSKTDTYFQVIDAGASPYDASAAYQAKSVPNGTSFTFYVKTVIDVNGTDPSQMVRVRFYLNTSATFVGAVDFIELSYPAVDGTHIDEVTIASTQANTTLIHQVVLDDGVGSYDVKTYLLSTVSETKTIDINCDCVPSQAEEGIYLSWQNNLGHFDYWFFTAYKDHITDIVDSAETSVNTFPNWPNSRGEFADTDKKKQTYRESFDQLLVRSQRLTKEQLNNIKSIKTSPLVQIVNSIYDRRTVIVDADSFTEYKEDQKLYEITFTITYTDDVPSQRV